MSKKIETYGRVEGGKLHVYKRDAFAASIAEWNDCRVRLTCEKVYKKRSLNQNDYYHAVLIHEFCEGALEMWGESIEHDQAHEILKRECNGSEMVNKETGEIVRFGKPTKGMTTVEFMEYVDRCIKFIAEWFGREVPAPLEQTKLFKD